ncbi:hypothetical protein FPV67DRAFT_1715799 [Lyophyllum atratum]|nr:hypothetical protein FPV67DRAFT_1715799 [Lyophyllum atratum]
MGKNKPLPPLDNLRPHIAKYWAMRKTDQEIIDILKEQEIFDTDRYGLGLTSFKAMRSEMGLHRTRKQGHTIYSIHEAMAALRVQYPKAGAVEMKSLLFHENAMHVINAYFREFEPELIRERKARRLKRRRFWAAGVNDLLAVDQHDKWMRFGLRLHTGIDPFAGRIQWMKVWFTNSDPKLIASYYLDFIAEVGHMPLVTQSDPGSENYGIANVTTALRHWHDPRLQGTLQHRWMRQKKNVMPEIAWSQLRRRFSPGFEDVLEYGVQEEWYDIDDPLDVLVFRWIFIPWLQTELDAYRNRVNNSKKRADRNKILPHGVPNDIYESPERYGCLDFKVKVDAEAIDYMRGLYAPPDNAVFELVPPSFESFAQALYETMGSPLVTRDNVWDVYHSLKQRFLRLDEALAYLEEWQEALAPEDNPQYQLITGQHDLLGGPDNVDMDGAYYMGGVNNGLGLDRSHHQELDEIEDEDLEVEGQQDEDDMDEVEALFGVQFTDQEYINTDITVQDQW